MKENTAKSFWEKNPNIMYDQQQWTSNPIICEKVYERMNGFETSTFWLNWFTSYYLKGKKVGRLLSPGCGTGLHEKFLMESGVFEKIDAFDISETSIHLANQTAEENNLPISFYVSDLNNFTTPVGKYDMIFCSGSLHHVKELEVFLKKIHSLLSEDGIFVINEYVGDCYGICNPKQLEIINTIYGGIHEDLRNEATKSKQVQNYSLEWALSVDPSESVRSKLIPPFLESYFDYEIKRPYGTNLFQYMYPLLNHEKFTSSTPEMASIIDIIFRFEDILLKKEIIESDFLFAIMKPKKNLYWS